MSGVHGLEEEASESEEEVKEGVDADLGVITIKAEGDVAIIGVVEEGEVGIKMKLEDGRTSGLNEERSASVSVASEEGIAET